MNQSLSNSPNALCSKVKVFFDLEKIYRLLKNHSRVYSYRFYIKHLDGINTLTVISKDKDYFQLTYTYEDFLPVLNTGDIELNSDLVEEIRRSRLKDVAKQQLVLENTKDILNLQQVDIQQNKYLSGKLIYDFVKSLPNDFSVVYLNDSCLFSYNDSNTRLQYGFINKVDSSKTSTVPQAAVSRFHIVSCLKFMQESKQVVITDNALSFQINKPFSASIVALFSDFSLTKKLLVLKPYVKNKRLFLKKDLFLDEAFKVYFLRDFTGEVALSEDSYKFIPDKFLLVLTSSDSMKVPCFAGTLLVEDMKYIRVVTPLFKPKKYNELQNK